MPGVAARNIIVGAGAIFAFHTVPAIAHNAHPAYDGINFGQREAIAPLSGELCANGILHTLTIEGGHLSGDGGDIRGRVVANGFFRGTVRIFGLEQPFEGRIENDRLLGGVISPDGACVWLIRMIRLDD